MSRFGRTDQSDRHLFATTARAPVSAPLSPVVAVPARDEADHLPRLLRAMNGQSWQARVGRRLAIVIALNNCRDESRACVEALRPGLDRLDIRIVEAEFEPSLAHAGSARRLAMETAAAIVGRSPSAVILTTDADAVPSDVWIEANLAAIAAGADAVGGLLIGDPSEEAMLGSGFVARAALFKRYAAAVVRLAALLDPLPFDPDPSHGDHTGGSLAVRADVYAVVGGIRALARREDVDLVRRLRTTGYRLRHAPDVRVVVSARCTGRASGGMADCIAGWVRDEAEGRLLLVEDPDRLISRLRLRASLRSVAAAGPWTAHQLAALVGEADAHRAMDEGCTTAGALIARFAEDDLDADATVPAAAAIATLEGWIAVLSGGRHAA